MAGTRASRSANDTENRCRHSRRFRRNCIALAVREPKADKGTFVNSYRIPSCYFIILSKASLDPCIRKLASFEESIERPSLRLYELPSREITRPSRNGAEQCQNEIRSNALSGRPP